MAVSSQTTYSKTKLELMNSVFNELNIIGTGMSASSDDYSRLSVILNDMLKAWTVDGPYLWAQEEGILYGEQYQKKYKLGDTAHATTEDDQIMTQINGALAAGVSSITVDTTTGMLADDHIGIVCSDKSLFWTTIDTVTSSTVLLLSDVLPSAVSDNAYVFTYTNTLLKPIRVKNIRTVSGIDLGSTSTLLELPLGELTPYDDFMAFSVKAFNSTFISMATYIPKRTTGELLIYPRLSDCSYRIHFTYARDVALLINTNDEIDLPQEWFECIKYQAMLRLAVPYGLTTKINSIAVMASAMLEKLQRQDQESLYISVVPRCN